ncbi:MAG: hypothetical protein JWM11_7329 [Planctomycetaceae bacterium]|nr:hypothetical protein [Planctomycetaceae bacterium]
MGSGSAIHSQQKTVRLTDESALRIWALLTVTCFCLNPVNLAQAGCGDYVVRSPHSRSMPQNRMHEEIASNDELAVTRANAASTKTRGNTQQSSILQDETSRTPARGRERPCAGPECRRRQPVVPVSTTGIEPVARQWAILDCMATPTVRRANWILAEFFPTSASETQGRIERPPRVTG